MLSYLPYHAAEVSASWRSGLKSRLVHIRASSPLCMQEVALIGLLSYLSYLAAEVAGLSGILALFCTGAAVSRYALHNVSPAGTWRLLTGSLCRCLEYELPADRQPAWSFKPRAAC